MRVWVSLGTFFTCLDLAEYLLWTIESIVLEANSTKSTKENRSELMRSTDGLQIPTDEQNSHMQMFLDKLTSPLVRTNPKIVKTVSRIMPFLTYGQVCSLSSPPTHYF